MAKRTCARDDCGNPHLAKGLCSLHYQRDTHGIPMDAPRRLRGLSPYERAMSNPVRREDGCLIDGDARDDQHRRWVGPNTARHTVYVAVWEHHNGPVSEGLVVRHTCDVPACIEITHLVVGTSGENSQDMVDRGRSLRGERSPQSLLREEDIPAIRADPRHPPAIAQDYGVHPDTIRAVKKRRTWSWVPD